MKIRRILAAILLAATLGAPTASADEPIDYISNLKIVAATVSRDGVATVKLRLDCHQVAFVRFKLWLTQGEAQWFSPREAWCEPGKRLRETFGFYYVDSPPFHPGKATWHAGSAVTAYAAGGAVDGLSLAGKHVRLWRERGVKQR